MNQPKNYGAHSFGQNEPSLDLQQQAFAAVATHPYFSMVSKYGFCEPIVLLEPKSFVSRMKLDEKIKNAIACALESCSTVLVVLYMTSRTPPEPLGGHGKTFDFVLHPETLEIIYASIGKWQS